MARVTFEPVPLDAMRRGSGVKFAPEILITDRLSLFGSPVSAFPGGNPLRDSVAQIFGVSEELDFARLVQRLHGRESGLHFHAIVGRRGGAARDFLCMVLISEDCSPPSRPGVPGTRAVAVNRHFFQGRQSVTQSCRTEQ